MATALSVTCKESSNNLDQLRIKTSDLPESGVECVGKVEHGAPRLI